jgi:transcriptional regulator with XRE-family HTH domain
MNSTNAAHADAGYRDLGEHIRRLRLAKGLGLREAARKAGVDATWLSRLEQGVYVSPDPRSIVKVAKALEVDVEELYVVAGLSTGQGLPGFAPYLRAKYDLPADAVAQLEAHFQLLNDKYQSKGDNNGRNNLNTA